VAEGPEPQLSPIVQKLLAWDAAVVAKSLEFRGEVTVEVPREHMLRACEYLRDEPGLEFGLLSDVSAVDRFPMEPRFELNYHLVSIRLRHALRLRVRLHGGPAPAPEAPSVTPVWPTADWHEREIFDLFGVRFEGHPDLRRILLPEDWEGYPLRKDYPVEGPR
jgi:NADH-quinone oxidoreductase subunit C